MTPLVDRLARLSVRLLTWAILFGIFAGLVVAVIWRRDVDWTVYNAPYVVTTLLLLAALLLATPAFLAGIANFARGEWNTGLRRMIPLIGAVGVFLGAELFSHYLVPCDWVIDRGWGTPDWGVPWGGQSGGFACRQVVTRFGDLNGVYSRIHLLHHTLLGGLPVLLLFRVLLGRTEKAREALLKPRAP